MESPYEASLKFSSALETQPFDKTNKPVQSHLRLSFPPKFIYVQIFIIINPPNAPNSRSSFHLFRTSSKIPTSKPNPSLKYPIINPLARQHGKKRHEFYLFSSFRIFLHALDRNETSIPFSPFFFLFPPAWIANSWTNRRVSPPPLPGIKSLVRKSRTV